jgi:16S rRNA (cytosine1402-N4)-methyltransferase
LINLLFTLPNCPDDLSCPQFPIPLFSPSQATCLCCCTRFWLRCTRFKDLTFGAGGYTKAILDTENCNVIAFDRDPDAIRDGQSLVAASQGCLTLIESDFGSFNAELADRNITSVDGVVMDIGVSSMQLDQAARGFSFLRDGPLDMRMAQSGPSAADIIATASADKLADIIYVFGEEHKSRAIARAILKARAEAPITTTRQLVAAVERATGPARPHLRTHPATKTFQALRIYINDELGQLVDALIAAEQVLKPGGRLVIVTFHSLEDRIAKQFLAERTGNLPGASRHAPGPTSITAPSFRLLQKGHIAASESEIAINPRCRSAKLRVAIRTEAEAWGKHGAFYKSVETMRAQ